MRHSIIVPTFRRTARLRALLRALGDLRCPAGEFEVVVVDDEVSAATASVVEEARASLAVRYVAQSERNGPASARNLGASHARGEYLAFLDDDCVPDPEWLARFDAALARDGDPHAALGGHTTSAPESSIFGVASQLLVDFLYEWYNGDRANAGFFTTNNLLCSREAFLAFGGFDESFLRAAAEDRDFCDRWRESGRRLVYVPEAVVHHHQRATLGQFLRQHVVYGRGAVDLHVTRDRRNVERPKLESMAFYAGLLRYPARREDGWRVAPLVVLAALSQVAYGWGYVSERLQRGAVATRDRGVPVASSRNRVFD